MPCHYLQSPSASHVALTSQVLDCPSRCFIHCRQPRRGASKLGVAICDRKCDLRTAAVTVAAVWTPRVRALLGYMDSMTGLHMYLIL